MTTSSSPRHHQVEMSIGGSTALVDEGLAPLIEGLWLLGIATRFSCQCTTRRINLMRQPRNVAYIMFPDPSDLLRMMGLFVGTDLDPRRRRSAWTYELFPRFDDEPDDGATAGSVGLHPVLYIPVEQLDTVTDVVRRSAQLVSQLGAA
ncbi:MAG: hypothetical protein ACKOAZ_08960 [Ilumatobacteraceae bacterium]